MGAHGNLYIRIALPWRRCVAAGLPKQPRAFNLDVIFFLGGGASLRFYFFDGILSGYSSYFTIVIERLSLGA